MSESRATLVSVPTLPPVSPTISVKRIVIIEDQTAIREMLAEILRIERTPGFQPRCAAGRRSIHSTVRDEGTLEH